MYEVRSRESEVGSQSNYVIKRIQFKSFYNLKVKEQLVKTSAGSASDFGLPSSSLFNHSLNHKTLNP